MGASNRKRLWAPLDRMRDWDHRRVMLLRETRNQGGEVIPEGAACISTGAPNGRVHLTWFSPEKGRHIGIRYVSNRDVRLVQ